MRIVTSKELARVPNGSLVIDMQQTKRDCTNELSLYEDRVPFIFCGNYGSQPYWKEGCWNGVCFLHPTAPSEYMCDLPFLDTDIDSGKDVAIVDREDIILSVDVDSNDFEPDALFAVYSEEEKQAFVKELLDYLGYDLQSVTKLLTDEAEDDDTEE